MDRCKRLEELLKKSAGTDAILDVLREEFPECTTKYPDDKQGLYDCIADKCSQGLADSLAESLGLNIHKEINRSKGLDGPSGA